MLIFSPTNSHRLRYMADFIGRLLTGEPAGITGNREAFIAAETIRINYSDQRLTPDECWIKPHPLLFQTGIREQVLVCSQWQLLPVFFQTGGDIPFDIFAAAFYLLTRYEEYLPHQKDLYGRYSHEQSLAFREGFLQRPVVDGWMQHFKGLLRKIFPAAVLKASHFKWVPTYDIDEAYSFKYKSWTRSAGAALRDILTGRFKHFNQRRKVLDGREADPFDAYAWMDDLHRPYSISPIYFFLVGRRFNNDANSKKVVNLLERNFFDLHFFIDRVHRFIAGIDFVLYSLGSHCFFNRIDKLLYKAFAFELGFLKF